MDQLTENPSLKINLKHGEDDLVAADPLQAAPMTDPQSLTLVGRVVIDRELSINSLRANIRRLLNPVKGVDIKPVGENMVTLKFAHPLDRKHALAGCPWAIERHPFLLEPLNPKIRPEKHVIDHIPIVVCIMQLSLANQSEPIAKIIGNNLGTFIEVPKSPLGQYYPYFRIKIAVDVTRPLKRGIFFQGVEGTKEWIQVVYERLPTFCFLCEVLGHGEAKCPTRYEAGFEEPEGELPYGSWIRANSESQGMLGIGGRTVRLIAADGSSSRRGTGDRRGSEVFEFGLLHGKEVRTGISKQNENANPNLYISEHSRLKPSYRLALQPNRSTRQRPRSLKGTSELWSPRINEKRRMWPYLRLAWQVSGSNYS